MRKQAKRWPFSTHYASLQYLQHTSFLVLFYTMLLSPNPDDALHQMFSSLEIDFLKAVIDSDSSTTDFADRFRDLHDASLSKLSGAPLPTITAAHRAASNLSILSSSLSELESASKEIKDDLMLDIDQILQQLTLEDPFSASGAQATGQNLLRVISLSVRWNT